MRALALLRTLKSLSAEVIRHEPRGAVSIMSKAARARIAHGVDPKAFLMLSMHKKPSSSWSDWLSYDDELEPGLRALNWQGDGKRLTVDKLATAERLSSRGLAIPKIYAVIGRDEAANLPAKDYPSLHSVEEVLAAIPGWPERCFVKPANGWQGQGVLGPERSAGGGWSVEGKHLSD